MDDETLKRMLRQAFTRGYQAARSGKGHKAEMEIVVTGLLRYRDQCAAPILASSEGATAEDARPRPHPTMPWLDEDDAP